MMRVYKLFLVYREAEMDRQTIRYLVFALVVMAIFGVYVRAFLLRPVASAAGPEVTHPLDGNFAGNCDICHRKEAALHEKTFGKFDNCMRCHGGAPKTPHPTTGNYVNCMNCHDKIASSHDVMFSNTSYQDCAGCHPQK
jgi:predicted CXXCH cytochrome family protein